jgi:serine/threonine protein kinase
MSGNPGSARVGAAGASGAIPAKTVVGGVYQVESLLRRTLVGAIYAATDTRAATPVSIHVVAPELAALEAVTEAVRVAANKASTVGEHKHLAHTIGVVRDGTHLFVVTEALEGSSLRELLARKQRTGVNGFGPRGAANITASVCSALMSAEDILPHGALSSESIYVSRQGRIRIVDLGLGAAAAAAVAAGAVPAPSWLAPEIAKGGEPSGPGDVYGLGALLYELLVGQPLSRGGQRPSEAVEGVSGEVDEFIARCCTAQADRRFGSAAVVKELVVELLHRAGGEEGETEGVNESEVGRSSPAIALPAAGVAPAERRPSLAQSLAQPATAATPAAPASSGTSSPSIPLPSASGALAAAASDPAMAAALANTAEKWLISKGKLDYGPFTMADVVEQIRANQIVPGNVIIDNDTRARVRVEDHPLLSRLVDAAKQRRDDMRRTEAEVKHGKSEKRRGVTLYAVIGVGVLAVATAVYFVVTLTGKAKEKSIDTVASIEAGELNAKISFPTKPKPQPKKPGSGGRSGGGGGTSGGGGGDDTLALDLSEEGGTETLDPGTINGVVQKYGGGLGRCMRGESYAHIEFVIEGKSGRVNWVRVNEKQAGSLYSCLNGVLRGMKFPSVDGPRSRAEFDISL